MVVLNPQLPSALSLGTLEHFDLLYISQELRDLRGHVISHPHHLASVGNRAGWTLPLPWIRSPRTSIAPPSPRFPSEEASGWEQNFYLDLNVLSVLTSVLQTPPQFRRILIHSLNSGKLLLVILHFSLFCDLRYRTQCSDSARLYIWHAKKSL